MKNFIFCAVWEDQFLLPLDWISENVLVRSSEDLIVMRILTAQKMKFCITDFLWIWSYLLKTSVMGNFIFCMVSVEKSDDVAVFRNLSLSLGVTLWNFKMLRF